jgi:hypothetical protein
VKKLGIFPLTLPSPARGEGEHNESKEEIPSPLRGEGQGGGDKGIFSQLQGGKGGFWEEIDMLRYNGNLKNKARQLRKNLTDSENALWSRLRNRQLLGVQFYRQEIIGGYIVDLYAPKAKLIRTQEIFRH